MSLYLTARGLMEALEREIDRDPAVGHYKVHGCVQEEGDSFYVLPLQQDCLRMDTKNKRFTIDV